MNAPRPRRLSVGTTTVLAWVAALPIGLLVAVAVYRVGWPEPVRSVVSLTACVTAVLIAHGAVWEICRPSAAAALWDDDRDD
ncbi:hypothetical protein ACW14Y_42900 [Kitasatospora sp. cg17-2]